MAKKASTVCELKCWKGRTVLLYRTTLLDHVLRLHIESAFVVEALKRRFSSPVLVVRNKHHGTANAYYDIETGGQPYLLVAVQFNKRTKLFGGKPNFIKSFYGVEGLPKTPDDRGNV